MFDVFSVPATVFAALAAVVWVVLASTVLRRHVVLRAAAVAVSWVCAVVAANTALVGFGYAVPWSTTSWFTIVTSTAFVLAAYCMWTIHAAHVRQRRIMLDGSDVHPTLRTHR